MVLMSSSPYLRSRSPCRSRDRGYFCCCSAACAALEPLCRFPFYICLAPVSSSYIASCSRAGMPIFLSIFFLLAGFSCISPTTSSIFYIYRSWFLLIIAIPCHLLRATYSATGPATRAVFCVCARPSHAANSTRDRHLFGVLRTANNSKTGAAVVPCRNRRRKRPSMTLPCCRTFSCLMPISRFLPHYLLPPPPSCNA